MNSKVVLAILLIIFGLMVMAYSGISITTPAESVPLLGLRVETQEKHFIPPVYGALALIGGIVLLLLKPRSA